MKILTILIPMSLLILAGCQKQTVNIETIGQPVGEIPDRPGLIEQVSGKKLEIGIL